MRKYYIRCGECGRFISTKDENAVCYTPFGGPTDIDPPEELFICGKCWTNRTSDELDLIKYISWMQPSKAF